ncbi:MAG: hypothetical protein LUO98_02000 [Methanoregula sp.]|nr:hypothetical protein [Methanoregula sp.]
MKHLILLFLAITGIMMSGCVLQTTPSSKTVRLALTIDEWGSWFPPQEAHEIKSLILDVKEGEEFGPADYFTAYQKTKPFKVLKIIDEDHIKIQFDEFLVVVGEPVSNPSRQNPIIISLEETCFRTRTSDSGADFCLKIVK